MLEPCTKHQCLLVHLLPNEVCPCDYRKDFCSFHVIGSDFYTYNVNLKLVYIFYLCLKEMNFWSLHVSEHIGLCSLTYILKIKTSMSDLNKIIILE